MLEEIYGHTNCFKYMLTYASECNMRFIFESFYFCHYFHECVARDKMIENKMTRKINLILHELEVYVKKLTIRYQQTSDLGDQKYD